MSPRQNTDSTASPSTPTTRSGPPLSRRAVIAGGGTAALVSLAGCSTIVNRLAEMALEEVNVFNGADRRVSGTIEIVDPNGEVVLEETFDLEADSQRGEDETNDAATAQYSDVWTDAGDYEASIELDETLADDSGTAGNETDSESADNSSDADTESAGNSSDAGTTNSSDSQMSADDESADNSSDSGTGAEGSEPGSSATETVAVDAPDEEHLVVGLDRGETDESISFHVIEEVSDLGEEFE